MHVPALGYAFAGGRAPLIPFTDPPLTTVRQPVLAMASAAVSALLDEIGGRGAPTPSTCSPRS